MATVCAKVYDHHGKTDGSYNVKIRVFHRGARKFIGTQHYERGIFTNPILYPAVARKDARIRISLMATHTRAHLDTALAVLEAVGRHFGLLGRASDQQ